VGTVQEMEHAPDEVVRQFLELDALVVPGTDSSGYGQVYT
jgi:hypothetical protein